MVFNNTRMFAWKLCFRGYFTMKNENLHHFSKIIIILFILFYVYIYIIIIITKGVKKIPTKSQATALYQWEILTGSQNNAFLHQSTATPPSWRFARRDGHRNDHESPRCFGHPTHTYAKSTGILYYILSSKLSYSHRSYDSSIFRSFIARVPP